MARLFEEIFTDEGSGDVCLIISELPHEMDNSEPTRLQCHSLILTQHDYFYKMLSIDHHLHEGRTREGRTREVWITEPRDDFIELLRFIYTGQIDIKGCNVAALLTLGDKYCIDDLVDLCLKYIRDSFDVDTFFKFYNFATLNSASFEKLKEQLMASLRQRRNLCAITEDLRWSELPIAFTEEILSQDDLPIASEAEVLTLIVQWIGLQRRSKQDVRRLLGAFRKAQNLVVRVSDIGYILEALGVSVFCEREPRSGAAVWDPAFVIHRHESAGPVPLGTAAAEPPTPDKSDDETICHQLGPKDFLQQEPGWMHPGVHQCRVTLNCGSWSHRERRLMRTGPAGRSPMEAAALQKRVFECSPAKPATHERSPSPPPSFRSRMPPMESFAEFDIGQREDEQFVLGGGVIRSHLSQDKFDHHELVDHQITCGVLSGYQRHGVRISQRERNAIYTVEDLNGKNTESIGGTTSSVSFDLELIIGEASNNGISRCRFAVLRSNNVLLEETFDVSAKVPIRFYFSSSNFDKNSSFTVSVDWLRPPEQQANPGQAHQPFSSASPGEECIGGVVPVDSCTPQPPHALRAAQGRHRSQPDLGLGAHHNPRISRVGNRAGGYRGQVDSL